MSLEKLKAYLRFKNKSYREISEKLREKGFTMTKETFSNKVNNTNGQEFSHSEIIGIKEVLCISNDEVIEYFF